MVIRRGDTWWADLGRRRGSAPAHRRPVLVISADSYNRSRIDTVICAVITSNVELGEAPGNVLLGADEGGLDRPSVVNVSQVITLDKVDLRDRLGALSASRMRSVELGLRRVLAL